MKFINQIEIKYFRSIYNLRIQKISESMTIFTGCNDVGKSNILRALNLFFNDETDVKTPLLFERDFSKIRRQEIKESRKARQLISISVEIITPRNYKILPSTFWVTRTFDRNNKVVEFSFDKAVSGDSKKLAVAKRLFNSLEFIYIPAVKDKGTFSQVLMMLKSNLPDWENKGFDTFNTKLQNYGKELKRDLEDKINLSPSLSLPTTSQELFSSLDFSIKDDKVVTSLSQRGDGIRCRFIPAIMNYIAGSNKGTRYIWGIEEPENSLEFIKAIELNDTLEDEYSKNAQIFVTSHSPAFVGFLRGQKVIYLLRRNRLGKVEIEGITANLFANEEKIKLSQELGYIILQQDLGKCLQEHILSVKRQEEELKQLAEELRKNDCVVFVEGSTDKMYFEEAFKIFGFKGFSIEIVGKQCGEHDEFCGDSALTKTKEVFKHNLAMLQNKKIVLLYDFDSKKKDEDFENKLFIRSTTCNNKEIIFKRGIENLLSFDSSFDRKSFYNTEEKIGAYGEKNCKSYLDKKRLAKYIIALSKEEKKMILSNLKIELDKISQIFYAKQ